MESYKNLYKKARQIYDAGEVVIVSTKINGNDKYIFKVKDYDTTLELSKMNSVWLRTWTCGCASYAMNDKIRCSHVMAAELYLMSE